MKVMITVNEKWDAWKSASEYFKYQFKLIKSKEDKRDDFKKE